MGKAHSDANKKRWASMSSEERSKKASILVSKRWKNTSIEDRKEYGKMLVAARTKK